LVAGLATTLAFTGILSLASMRALFRHSLERDSRLSGSVGCIGANRERPGHEPGHRGACNECFRCIHLVFGFLAFEPLVAVIDREMLKIGSMCIEKCFNEDYASPHWMEL
jgi:hypothetical protein